MIVRSCFFLKIEARATTKNRFNDTKRSIFEKKSIRSRHPYVAPANSSRKPRPPAKYLTCDSLRWQVDFPEGNRPRPGFHLEQGVRESSKARRRRFQRRPQVALSPIRAHSSAEPHAKPISLRNRNREGPVSTVVGSSAVTVEAWAGKTERMSDRLEVSLA